MSSATERLPVYDELNTSNDSVESIDQIPKRRRGSAKEYDLLQSFDTLSLATTFLKNDRFKWVYHKKNSPSEGVKMFYYCNGKNCPCKLYILCHSSSLRASIFASIDEHGHDSLYKTGIDDKEIYYSLLDNLSFVFIFYFNYYFLLADWPFVLVFFLLKYSYWLINYLNKLRALP